MNSQERDALQDFLHELARGRVQHKDPEAEAMILRTVSNVPDAPYLLVQRVLLQEQALNAARRQIASLQRRLEATLPHDGGFLSPSSDWGHSEFRTHPSHAKHHPGSAYRYGDPRGYYDPRMVRPGLMGGGAGGFLGSMAGVAAGALAGSFLYHGIDDLLHHDHADANSQQGLADMSGDAGQAERFTSDTGWDSGDLAGDAGIDDIGFSDDSGMGGGEGDFL
ncbi:MAG TPA: DUF2076 family protein [Noviherbaspirillum sp.]|jgi:hypothetical protein|uniref:DUF2076 domain-containing protein n=1 Tax=Noviherbaspirillum sp. TaxID=1926288 RepID=UPI002DDCA4C1|nr:DUF2076 family protein [Noviherbaspirillum sp.]HEV2610971.1 DUF2076 family protein [Noviherbaspirillum sp.]